MRTSLTPLLSSSWRIFAAIRSEAKRQWTYSLDTDRSKSRTSTSKQPFFIIFSCRGGLSSQSFSISSSFLRCSSFSGQLFSFLHFLLFPPSIFYRRPSAVTQAFSTFPSISTETPQAEGFFGPLSRRWLAKISDFLRCVFIIYLLFLFCFLFPMVPACHLSSTVSLILLPHRNFQPTQPPFPTSFQPISPMRIEPKSSNLGEINLIGSILS